MQKTCCQRAEIVLTVGDFERIARFTSREDFSEHRAALDPSYAEFDANDPNWLAYTTREDGTRHVLVREADGDCTFLGEAGCNLPETVRPLVCRLYPWSYTEAGIDGVADEYCPRSVMASAASTVEALEMRIEDGIVWHRQLYDELRSRQPAETPQRELVG